MTDRLAARIESIAVDAADHHEFRAAADQLLRKEIGYDVATWASFDPSTHLFTSCDVITAFGSAPHELMAEAQIFAHEFANQDPLTYSKMINAGQDVARLRAEVDDPTTVDRFRTVLAPAGADDEMRVVLRDATGVWGTVSMYRAAWWTPFDEKAERSMASISTAMAGVFRHAFLVAGTGAGHRPPGAFAIDANGSIVATSGPAERWLDTLSANQLRGTLAALNSRLAAEPIARATVPGTEGPVTLHAFTRKGTDDEIEVVIEQPRPAELAEVIMAAHGLTPREADVARLVMQGLTTRLMANELRISEYTVQDHLKSAFAKFDVVSRGELLHAVYSRHYLPKRNSDAVPGPYGFFLPG